jgi:hypothetical protein
MLTVSQHLDSVSERVEDQISRFESVITRISDAKWNEPGDPLSIGQIVEHVAISNRIYMQKLQNLVIKAAVGEEIVKYSRVGAFLIRVAGPNGDAPIPRPLQPRSGTVPRMETVEEFQSQAAQILELCKIGQSRKLSSARMPHPLIPILRMNASDIFELFAEHGERHLRQIEARLS